MITSPKSQDYSLYFHVPFCEKKCGYCHFFVLPNKPLYHTTLVEGFKGELLKWQPNLYHKNLVSIYFGGGTPSLLGAAALEKLIDQILKELGASRDDLEISLEANPEKLTFNELQAFKQAGINRLSIGVQSLDDPLLKTLGREHSALQAMLAIENAARAGFDNLSIDLMYDLPYQTESSWEQTLQEAMKLPIQHLSLYNLTIEPHTAFFKYREKLQPELPSDEESRRMLEKACAIFDQNLFKRYEISAFAKDQKYSRHNTGYWLGRPFLGLGPSAFSYWEGKRFRNIANLNRYSESIQKGQSPIDFEEFLEGEDAVRELLAIRLRLLQGVDVIEFQQITGTFSEALLKDIEKCVRHEWLIEKQGRLCLTELGYLFYDSVAEQLIGDAD